MTGYIWLCDICDGNGSFFMADPLSNKIQLFMLPEGPVLRQFKEFPPKLCLCWICGGKGYWEP